MLETSDLKKIISVFYRYSTPYYKKASMNLTQILKRFVLVFSLTLMVYSCGKDEDPASSIRPEYSENKNDNLSVRTLTHASINREYLLYIPTSYDGTRDVPLLFNFHGGTDSAHRQLAYVDMREIADAENFILIYPQAFLEGGETNWNTLKSKEISKLSSDDFGFIAAIIDSMSAAYRIDTLRVYATGYSNGAGMSYALACQLSNKIAAVAPVSGLMPIDGMEYPCAPTHPTSMLIINGTADISRPYNGIDGYLLSVEEAISFWTEHNGLDNPPTSAILDNGELTMNRYDYLGGENGTEVRHYRINGGGHVWFDFSDGGVEHNQIIWNFLSRFDLNGAR